MIDELEERIEAIRQENFVWIIYLVVIGISYYANKLEIDYFKTNNEESAKWYRYLEILVFSIVTIIYLYFTIKDYMEVMSLSDDDSYNKKKYAYLSLISDVAVLFAAGILLYIAIDDRNIEAEIFFDQWVIFCIR